MICHMPMCHYGEVDEGMSKKLESFNVLVTYTKSIITIKRMQECSMVSVDFG